MRVRVVMGVERLAGGHRDTCTFECPDEVRPGDRVVCETEHGTRPGVVVALGSTYGGYVKRARLLT